MAVQRRLDDPLDLVSVGKAWAGPQVVGDCVDEVARAHRLVPEHRKRVATVGWPVVVVGNREFFGVVGTATQPPYL